MKNIVKSKMKTIRIMAIALLAIIAYGCAEEQKFDPAPANNPAITRLTEAADELRVQLDEAVFGKKKGMYPVESRSILTEAIAEISRLVLNIHSGTKSPTEAEISQAINTAKEEGNRFKGTVLTEDIPWDGKPVELYVDGLNDGYIDFGASGAFTNFGTMTQQQFTIEFWVKMTKVRDDIGAVISAFRENGGDRTGWLINYRNYDFMRVSLATGEDGRGLFEEGTGYMGRGDWIQDGQVVENLNSPWLHIALVYNDNGRGKLYLNGVIKEGRVDWAINDWMKADFEPFLNMTAFVQRDVNGKLTRPVAGYLKHFRIWKAAKNAEEVNDLMNGKAVTGRESDLVCAWPLDETVEDDKDILDLTGRHSAAVRGTYRWEEKE